MITDRTTFIGKQRQIISIVGIIGLILCMVLGMALTPIFSQGIIIGMGLSPLVGALCAVGATVYFNR